MKWLIGILVGLNLFVFFLANLIDDNKQNDQQSSQIGENVAAINMLDTGASPLPGNCSNVGPIEQQATLDRLENLLVEKSLSYRLISEAARKVTAYRVIVLVTSDAHAGELKLRLEKTGIDESYETTLTTGQRVLSLGVFTYKDTAFELANNLSQTGLAAKAEREFLQYPKRYWVNLNQPLDNATLAGLNNYVGENKLQQTTAKCL